MDWSQLEQAARAKLNSIVDYEDGPTNSQSTLRLFGHPKSSVRVTLYRDNHAWCPYCQKVWLWLEEKGIPYQVKKVSMRCCKCNYECLYF